MPVFAGKTEEKTYADRFCIMEMGQLVVGGAIGELNERLVRRHLTV